jgi:hypothetical protein
MVIGMLIMMFHDDYPINMVIFHSYGIDNHSYWDDYYLVNVYITNWKDPPCFMGKLTISMAMFNNYVSLPEGNPQKGI